MTHLDRYTGISVLLHGLLILWFVGMGFSMKDKPHREVYEVDIVTAAPSRAQAESRQTRYINKRGAEPVKTLAGIQKEKALPDIKPELSPSKMEPVPEKTHEPEPDIVPDTRPSSQQQTGAPPVSGAQGTTSSGAVQNEVAYYTSIWNAQIKSIYDKSWKAPAEISYTDKSLKTTYSLKVSRSGEILDRKLFLSSGNKLYDRYVMLTLMSIKRLPTPPAILMSGKDSIDLILSFIPPKGAN